MRLRWCETELPGLTLRLKWSRSSVRDETLFPDGSTKENRGTFLGECLNMASADRALAHLIMYMGETVHRNRRRTYFNR